MIELIRFCKEQIANCDTLLEPFFQKYDCKNSFHLSHLKTVSDADRREILQHVYRKDAFVQLLNRTLAMYDSPIQEGDKDLDIKRRCVFSTAGLVLNKVSDPNFAQWQTVDGIPTRVHLEQVIQCIAADELESAAFGILYALYQKRIEKTNRADRKLEELFKAPLALPAPTTDPS